MVKKKVYNANTGGTIGMENTSQGYAPTPRFQQQQQERIADLQRHEIPGFTVNEYRPLLDSSNMTPAHWLRIARDIAENYADYDGFIVLHGTDTMAYTASALSFMLAGLSKPVVLTGSQIPLCEIRNDARENLISSLLIAGNYPIPEVCLYFGNKLLRGNRSVKVDADALNAFDSPNFPPLGEAGVNIEINWNLVYRPAARPGPPLEVLELEDPSVVGALRLFPGISARMLRNILKPPLQGLVLEAFGVGNGPEEDREFLQALQEATERGVVIVDCTQCLRGTVQLEDYASGRELALAGVVSGFDMTAEAALTKLFWLLDGKRRPQEVRALMQSNLRGEMTV